MLKSILGGLRPKEVRNIASVAGVAVLLIGVISLLFDHTIIESYPQWVFACIVGGLFGIAGSASIVLQSLHTAEAKLVIIFLLVMSTVGGFMILLFSGYGNIFIVYAGVGLLVGVGGGLMIRSSGIPNHSTLVGIWLLFIVVTGIIVSLMMLYLLREGELMTIIVTAVLFILSYLIHSTLLRERESQMNINP